MKDSQKMMVLAMMIPFLGGLGIFFCGDFVDTDLAAVAVMGCGWVAAIIAVEAQMHKKYEE